MKLTHREKLIFPKVALRGDGRGLVFRTEVRFVKTGTENGPSPTVIAEPGDLIMTEGEREGDVLINLTRAGYNMPHTTFTLDEAITATNPKAN